MAEVLRYVDPDVVAGDGSGDSWINAYASLNAWEAAEETDLDTANNTHRVLCRSLSGSNDQLQCTILGWTTSATDYITVEGYDFPLDGIWDDTEYIIENNDDQSSAIYIREEYVRIRKLQALVTTTSDARHGIHSNLLAASNQLYIDSCIIKGVCSGSDSSNGISLYDDETVADVYNCIVYGFRSTGDDINDTGFAGIFSKSSINIFNCTISGCYYGIREAGDGTHTAINCAVFNNADDFNGSFVSIDYCATDEHAGGGTNGVDISGTWDSTCFVNHATFNFAVQDADSPVYNTGNGSTPKGTFTDDIIDADRSGIADLDWDIGAFELVVTVGNAGIMTTNTGYWGPTF